ncbi:hypothetical protein [Bizionia arctica]|uniref:DUF4129 domain-containing protein n=1 Tax=Bizionia arctica TaxID=1495645 RepID=A0A917LNV1_9FLAO|nr:hypothetical protein [Bizionia arctica]GGG47476.1 hypothetical protein GCM10010976_18620 [Bizionia arctica]
MKKCLLLLFLLTSLIGFSKSFQDTLQASEASNTYNKTTEFEDKLVFIPDLKEKYNDKEFTYVDNLKEVEPAKEEVSSPGSMGLLAALAGFLTYFFPFLLGIIVVFIILKAFLGTGMDFWNFKKASKKVADKLIYEDEDIHEADFNKLLENAITHADYRLATRYYYLSLLKKLSDKKSIAYHKDKTNTDYLFEIENKDIRSQFSQVSHIYSYVWYGEFPIDSLKFQTVEKKYKTLFNSIN